MKNMQVYAILLFVMLWWGLNVTMLKVLTAHLDPLIMQSVRITLAGMTIFILLFLFRQKLYERQMPWKSSTAFLSPLLGCILGGTFMDVNSREFNVLVIPLLLNWCIFLCWLLCYFLKVWKSL